MPDICHAPDWPSIRADGARELTPAVLERFHNAPAWMRLNSTRRQSEDRYSNSRDVLGKEEREEKEEIMAKKITEKTQKILGLFREGKSYKEIAAEMDIDVHNAQVCVSAARKNGEPGLERHMAKGSKGKAVLVEHKKAAVPTEVQPEPVATVVPAAPILKAVPSDLSTIHAMLDQAAKLPELKAALLKACDEMESSANYILHQVKEIRGALGA